MFPTQTSSLFERFFSPQIFLKPSDRIGQPLPNASEALRDTFRIAWPSMCESILTSLVSMMDTIMVGGLGSAAIASVGLTNQPRFIVLALFMSLNVGITAVVSRRRGENDRQSANHTLRQSLLLILILSLLLSTLGILFAHPLLKFAGAQADTIDNAVGYFQILMGGTFLNTLMMAINAAQRGVGNTRLSFRTNLVANLVNVFFNYLLIGGNWGFPRLEVRGAAIATVIGYLAGFGLALSSVLRKDQFLHVSFHESFLPDKRNFSSLMNVGASAAIEQVFMRIGFFTFAKIVAGLGTTAFATHQICMNLINLSFSLGDGLAASSASLVGQNLGRKRPDLASAYGNVAQRVGLCLGAVLVTLFIVFRRFLILPFSSEPDIIALGSQIIIIMALMVPGQVSQVIFSNCLRVAGDTKYVAVTSLISITFLRPFAGWLFCTPLGLGLVGAWLGFLLDQYTRLTLNMTRFRRGKWKHIEL
ncbi:MATE family efflux transporter [Acidaminobacterium chupaoyuni]